MAVGTMLLAMSGWVLPGQSVGQVNDYGPVGATFVLSIWLVTLSAIILIGALGGVVHAERRLAAAPRAATLEPSTL